MRLSKSSITTSKTLMGVGFFTTKCWIQEALSTTCFHNQRNGSTLIQEPKLSLGLWTRHIAEDALSFEQNVIDIWNHSSSVPQSISIAYPILNELVVLWILR